MRSTVLWSEKSLYNELHSAYLLTIPAPSTALLCSALLWVFSLVHLAVMVSRLVTRAGGRYVLWSGCLSSCYRTKLVVKYNQTACCMLYLVCSVQGQPATTTPGRTTARPWTCILTSTQKSFMFCLLLLKQWNRLGSCKNFYAISMNPCSSYNLS